MRTRKLSQANKDSYEQKQLLNKLFAINSHCVHSDRYSYWEERTERAEDHRRRGFPTFLMRLQFISRDNWAHGR